MTDAALSVAQPLAMGAVGGGEHRPPTIITDKYPCYDIYETADGRNVPMAALEPPFWANLCRAVDRPDLVDAHLSTDPETRDALATGLWDLFRSRTPEEWETELADSEAMVAPVNTIAEGYLITCAREMCSLLTMALTDWASPR